DLVVAACITASLLTAQRMLSRPTPRTTDQVKLASLLMIAGGAVLSADLLFALCLFGYTALAVLSQGLSVVAASGPGPFPSTSRVFQPAGERTEHPARRGERSRAARRRAGPRDGRSAAVLRPLPAPVLERGRPPGRSIAGRRDDGLRRRSSSRRVGGPQVQPPGGVPGAHRSGPGHRRPGRLLGGTPLRHVRRRAVVHPGAPEPSGAAGDA